MGMPSYVAAPYHGDPLRVFDKLRVAIQDKEGARRPGPGAQRPRHPSFGPIGQTLSKAGKLVRVPTNHAGLVVINHE